LCPSISDAFWDSEDFWKCLEVVWEFGSKYITENSPEVSIEVKNKARSLGVTKIISGSLEQRFKVYGGQ